MCDEKKRINYICNHPQPRIPVKLLVRLYAGHVKVAEIEDHGLWLKIINDIKSIEQFDSHLELLRLEAVNLSEERRLLEKAMKAKQALDESDE